MLKNSKPPICMLEIRCFWHAQKCFAFLTYPNKMSKQIKKVIFGLGTLIVGIVLFILTIKYIGIQAIINQFKTIQPTHILFYLMISTTIVIVLIIKWKLILKALGFKIPFFNLFMYRQMGFSVGYIIPSFYIGGETVRAFFLKKHKVPLTDAISSVIIDRAVELPMNFFLACIMFFLVVHTLNLPKLLLIISAIIMAILILIGLAFYYKMYQKEYFFTYIFEILKLDRIKKLLKFKKKIMETETNLIKFFNHRKKFFIISLLISCLLWFLMILEFKTALMIVGYNASLAQIYLVVTMTGFAMLFPIPASIGVLELSQIGISILVGIPPAVAVALSLLVRTRDFMWIVSGIIFYIYHGTSYIRTITKDFTNNTK